MKLSRYTTEIKIDEQKSMLYNTLSRKYYVYEQENSKYIFDILKEMNKGIYSKIEIDLLKVLLQNNIVVQDNVDEITELRVLESASKYQDSVYKILIYITNNCNFRCTYCTQEHVNKVLQEEVVENIFNLIRKLVKTVKTIKIDWFGGEPILELDKMLYMLKTINDICIEEGSKLYSTITTNGYLLTEQVLDEMKNLNVKSMQITVDGNQVTHDARRKLANGKGSFHRVLENINSALKCGMKITLRINVDEENILDISEVLDGINKEYRSNVLVSISNLFQNKERLTTYSLLKDALDRGYNVLGRNNTYVHCHACLKNAVVIDTDGSVLLCSNTDSKEKRMGYLDKCGNIKIERKADYYRLKSLSAIENSSCRECIELPYCIGSCKYSRMKDNTECIGKNADGLTLRERALLDYYSDLKINQK